MKTALRSKFGKRNRLRRFIRYYDLEKYLFDEVTRNFRRNRYLAPEEFMAIVIWKSNRSKTNVREGIIKSGQSVRRITETLAKAKEAIDKLNILLGISGIGIPIASAILTVCYPRKFTVVDYRAIAALGRFRNLAEDALQRELRGKPNSSVLAYLAYVGLCGKVAKERGVSLREFDKILWGCDFYEGDGGLRGLAEGL